LGNIGTQRFASAFLRHNDLLGALDDSISSEGDHVGKCGMSRALISWKEECDIIHSQMDRLLAAGWPETAEERQVRKIQFMAMIERRNISAQKFLKTNGEAAKRPIRRRE
jgi:hypothetical protein